MAVYVCRNCSYQQDLPWPNVCPSCCGFYRPTKQGPDKTEHKERIVLDGSTSIAPVEHIPTGMDGFDHVLSGGLVPGDAVLFGGFRGTGKTTVVLQALGTLSKRRKCMFASSEQTGEKVAQTAQRAGVKSSNFVAYGGQRYIEDTLEHVRRERPFCVVYDSLQKYLSKMSAGSPGSATQGMAVAQAIIDDCHESGRSAIIINQMARSGELKGGTDVEHEVDAIIIYAYPKDDDEEAPEEKGVRILFVEKNRNGDENAKSYWRMTSGGLERVPARSPIIDPGDDDDDRGPPKRGPKKGLDKSLWGG